MFAIVFGFFIIYRIVTITYQIVHDKVPASEACHGPASFVGLIGNTKFLTDITTLGSLIIVIGLVVIGFKLRKVHDAYYIKGEFMLLMITAIILLPFFVVGSYSGNRAVILGCSWVILIGCNVAAFVRYSYRIVF
jgi:hypothetical protein